MKFIDAVKDPKQFVTKLCWRLYAGNVGRSLIHLGALGCLFSAVAQVGMIKKRKDLDPKEKEFILNQEKADGAFNVISYYTICEGVKQTGDMLLERGHFMTRKCFTRIQQIKQTSNSISDFVKAMNEDLAGRAFIKKARKSKRMTNFFDGVIAALDRFQLPKNATEAKIAERDWIMSKVFEQHPVLKQALEKVVVSEDKIARTRKHLNSARREFAEFKNGVGVFSAVAASVLSCNIIAPIVRNKIANHYQEKRMIHDQKILNHEKTKISRAYMRQINPFPKAFDAFNI